jgi:DNA transposition AAA+ family ATPase
MEQNEKQLLSEEIRRLADKTSQNKVAARAGVAPATISAILNHNWKLVADEMWRKVQSTLRIDLNWKHADTSGYRTLQIQLKAAKSQSLSIAVAYFEGRSKTHSYRRFELEQDNTIYVECKTFWTRKSYLQALMQAAGMPKTKTEGTIQYLYESFVDHVRGMVKPTIINDQTDKLKDPSLDLSIDLFNDLQGQCAFVQSGTPALRERIIRGVNSNRTGYREWYSRIGRKFITLQETSLEDATVICNANGVYDENTILDIYAISEGDIRVIRKEVEKYWLINGKAA